MTGFEHGERFADEGAQGIAPRRGQPGGRHRDGQGIDAGELRRLDPEGDVRAFAPARESLAGGHDAPPAAMRPVAGRCPHVEHAPASVTAPERRLSTLTPPARATASASAAEGRRFLASTLRRTPMTSARHSIEP
jgi:hypothetical protein